MGTITWSSWSEVEDDDEEPTVLSTPMTVMGTPSTSTVWPTGSAPLKSSDAVSEPRTATAVWSVTSWSSMKRPWVTLRLRTVSQLGVVPFTVVVQLEDPAVSVSDDEAIGATALMSGADRLEARAVASVSVRVDAEPNPLRIPLDEVVLPGEMVNRLVPRALISELTWFWAPWPRPTVRMTAAMPIMMPRTVRPDRRRWVRMALSPVRRVSSQLTAPAPGRGGSARRAAGWSARPGRPPRRRG